MAEVLGPDPTCQSFRGSEVASPSDPVVGVGVNVDHAIWRVVVRIRLDELGYGELRYRGHWRRCEDHATELLVLTRCGVPTRSLDAALAGPGSTAEAPEVLAGKSSAGSGSQMCSRTAHTYTFNTHSFLAPSDACRNMSGPLTTDFTRLFRVRHPILNAGMDVVASPSLASAVTNAGGLGVFGGVHFSPRSAYAVRHSPPAADAHAGF